MLTISKYLGIVSRQPARGLLNYRALQQLTSGSRLFSISSKAMGIKVALVLSGCGVYDGSELHEASACMVHLSRAGAELTVFAPDIEQMHTIDHTKAEPSQDKRNVLVESARIARGNVAKLSDLHAKDFNAVVFPGGFGAAKNLSNFAVNGKDCTVISDVKRVFGEFAGKKPIGLCCISPVLAAKLIPGCEVTIGSCKDTAAVINAMGGKHIEKSVTESHIDTANKVVTTPAFMCGDAHYHEIFDGIGSMINNVVKLA